MGIGAERTEDEVACVHTMSGRGMQGCSLNGLKPEHLERSAHKERSLENEKQLEDECTPFLVDHK